MSSKEKEPWIVERFYKDQEPIQIGSIDDSEDIEKSLKALGFSDISTAQYEGYFFVNYPDTQYIQHDEWYHEEKKLWYLSLWNDNGKLFDFCCTSYKERVECMKFILDYVVQLIKYQKMMKDMTSEYDD